MQNLLRKKTLHLKISLLIFLAVLSPLAITFYLSLNPILSFIIGGGVTLLGITLSFWLFKPLDKLIKSTWDFSDGNLNRRIDIRSGDEFEEVGNAFNLMAQKLSQTFSKLASDREIAISERNKINEILSSIIDGIIAVDFNKNIMLINKAAQELTGYTQEEVFGKPIDSIVHLYAEQEEILPKNYCQGSFNKSANLVGKMGRQTKVNLMTTTVDGQVQTNLGCILILHDLSKEEELERMKLDFVSMASHELKTPLTSIIGYLSVFLNENRKKITKEELELLDKAFVAARQLQTLIQNLLNVNKIEREQLAVSPEPTDYMDILSKSVEDLKAQASQKNILLTLVTPQSPLPKVLADSIRTGEVITNLLANAINYTSPGGKVDVFTQTSPNEITTVVSDTGLGIPKEAIPHLFSKFFRVSNQVQKGGKGTGLGLYIAKSIIEKLNGKIWVESELGKGSKFYFTLPLLSQTRGMLNSDKFAAQSIQAGSLNY
ncbi:PAS domain S-box protein [Candidatus Daviesbacteria bacterium]|nr:PAS domain S-box protein [Candidatus Daviesbacteria bacterium]